MTICGVGVPDRIGPVHARRVSKGQAMTRWTSLWRGLFAAGAGLLLAIAAPLAASAHVAITPGTAASGSFAFVTFNVPNESATATTDMFEVELPTDTPLLSVSYVPVAGWSTQLVREKLPKPVTVGGNTITEAVTKIMWTADAGKGITAGQLQLFPVSLGPVPDVGHIVFVAHQTYSDGEVVSWSETTEAANLPAPILYVNDTPPADQHGAAATDDVHADTHASEGADDHTSDTASAADPIARGLGIGGLVLAAIATVAAIAAFRRRATS